MESRELIIVREQEPLPDEYSERIKDVITRLKHNRNFMDIPEYLGINYVNDQIWSSYYVGACNLPDNLPDLVVLPKFPDLDFLEMLSECVDYVPSAEYFGKCYGINTTGEKIECGDMYNLLSPLLAMHYILILERLVNKGLSRNYIEQESNLKSKVKGSIVYMKDWKKNVLYARHDRVLCRFNEFSEDIPINRILKKAFVIASSLLNSLSSRSVSANVLNLRKCQNKIENAFIKVGNDNILSYSIPKRSNKLNPYYPEALNIAIDIIAHKENCIVKDNKQKKYVRPFWIDMSRLFEVYVLAKLQKKYGEIIEFQVSGYKACADYIHRLEHIIIDAKYKPIYQGNSFDINDIREISGNARDNKICSRFIDYDGAEPKCVIMYPDSSGQEEFGEKILSSKSTKTISQFRGFYKIGISLPCIKATTV